MWCNVTATIVPFPQIRRRHLIERTAERIAGGPVATGKKLLMATLRQQSAAMARKEIPEALIMREQRSLELAIRAELWRRVMGVA